MTLVIGENLPREVIRVAECYAHTGSDAEDVSTWQTLVEHASEVARHAEEFAAAFGMAAWGRTLGLLHDAGKASVGFQKRLQGGPSVDHATAGAKIAIERYGVYGQLMAYVLVGPSRRDAQRHRQNPMPRSLVRLPEDAA